ncbi:MAG: hypothetical protein C0504_09345 [Candidatus Solibacter sp.]|nr:hypothetical protein [Candidatus Solibacter sp.]
MSSYRPREVASALQRKGFDRDKTHHFMFWLVVNGKRTTIRTRYSHSDRQIEGGRIGQMSKQMKLSKHQFEDFVDCRLTGEAYAEMLIHAGEVVG